MQLTSLKNIQTDRNCSLLNIYQPNTFFYFAIESTNGFCEQCINTNPWYFLNIVENLTNYFSLDQRHNSEVEKLSLSLTLTMFALNK